MDDRLFGGLKGEIVRNYGIGALGGMIEEVVYGLLC